MEKKSGFCNKKIEVFTFSGNTDITNTTEGDKNSLGGEQNLPEYFFTCPNMTNLVGNITKVDRLTAPISN